MERLARLITRHPIAILTASLVLTLVLGAGSAKLTSRNNYESDLPLLDPAVVEQTRFEAAFGDEQLMLVAIESTDLLSDPVLAKIERISTELAEVSGMRRSGISGLSTIRARPDDPGSVSVLDFLRNAEPENRRALLSLLPQTIGSLSADFSTTLITAPVSRTAPQSVVASQIQQIVTRYEGPERIYVIGDHTVAQAIDEGIESDLALLLPLAFLLILAVLGICLGGLREAALPACVMVCSVIWTLGLMGHLGIPLNVVTSTLPILLVAVASSYGIHVVRQFASLADTPNRVGVLLKELGRPILLTGSTSAAGALSLLVFQVQSIREFGLFAGFGIASATVATLTLLPAALVLTGRARKSSTTSAVVDRLLTGLGKSTLRHQRVVLGALAAVLVVSAIGISRVQIGMDPVSMFPAGHPVRKATAVLNAQFSGCRYFDVMINGKARGSVIDPGTVDVIRSFSKSVRELPDVTAVYSIADFIPLGVPASDVMSGLKVSGFVDSQVRRTRVTVMTRATDQADQSRIYGQIRAVADQVIAEPFTVSFGGPVLRWIAQNRYVSIGKVLSVIAASVFVFLACTTAFRSIRTGLLASTPLILSTVTTFGVMGWAGIRLNMATAITTAIGLGIGVDFGIHFLSRLRNELVSSGLEQAVVRTMLTTGRAVLYDVASNVVGFGVLIFSVFGPVQDFGWLISLTMITSAAGTLIILPAAAAWLSEADIRPRFVPSIRQLLEAR